MKSASRLSLSSTPGLGLGQTISVVETFGDTYSSGIIVFGAGDSAEIQRQRILGLLRKRQT